MSERKKIALASEANSERERERETAQPPQRHGSGRKKDRGAQNNGMEVAIVDYASHATRFECLWAPKWRERKAGEIITQATKRATRQFCSSGGKEGRREGRGLRSPSVRRFVRSFGCSAAIYEK